MEQVATATRKWSILVPEPTEPTWASRKKCPICKRSMATNGKTCWCFFCEEKELKDMLSIVSDVDDFYLLHKYYYYKLTTREEEYDMGRIKSLLGKYSFPPRDNYTYNRG